ncbi:hypothetical protein J3E64_004156 [Sphingobium sp. OAS761]|nr:hypothetical protein [Sphingobium sp. OAS761]
MPWRHGSVIGAFAAGQATGVRAMIVHKYIWLSENYRIVG